MARTAVVPFALAVTCARCGCAVSTTATDGFELVHVNVMPVITLLSVSRAMARYGRPLLNAVNVKLSGAGAPVESYVTSMVRIGDLTVRFDTPVALPEVALICVVPIDSAVATPVLAFTDATEGAVDDHANVGCVASATLLPSTACAVKVNVPPVYSDRLAGVTLIVAMRCCTTVSDESFEPPVSVATTYVEPLATEVTTPDALTVAIAVLRLR